MEIHSFQTVTKRCYSDTLILFFVDTLEALKSHLRGTVHFFTILLYFTITDYLSSQIARVIVILVSTYLIGSNTA